MARVTVRTIHASILTRINALVPATESAERWTHVVEPVSLAAVAQRQQSVYRAFQVLPGAGGSAREVGATGFSDIERRTPFTVILAWREVADIEESLLVVQEDLEGVRNTLMNDAGGNQRLVPIGGDWPSPEVGEGAIVVQWPFEAQHYVASWGVP